MTRRALPNATFAAVLWFCAVAAGCPKAPPTHEATSPDRQEVAAIDAGTSSKHDEHELPPTPKRDEPTGPKDEAPMTATEMARLTGSWEGSDEEKWKYELTIDSDWAFVQTIIRSAKDKCVQRGKVEISGSELKKSFTANECNPSYATATIADELLDLTDTTLYLRTASGVEIRYRRKR